MSVRTRGGDTSSPTADPPPPPGGSCGPAPPRTHLVSVSGEAAALHGAGVEVALVVELEAGQAGVQLVQDGRQAAPQGQQLRAGAVEADAHGALQRHAASVTQQRAEGNQQNTGQVSRRNQPDQNRSTPPFVKQ